MYEKKIIKNFDCGLNVTLEVMGGKWKACIISSIYNGDKKPSEIQKKHPEANKRVLNLQLKELEKHGIVTKLIYPVLPPKVEYSLTDLGLTLLPIIKVMIEWGDKNKSNF